MEYKFDDHEYEWFKTEFYKLAKKNNFAKNLSYY